MIIKMSNSPAPGKGDKQNRASILDPIVYLALNARADEKKYITSALINILFTIIAFH